MSGLEKGKISPTQLIYLLITYNAGVSMIITVGIEARQDAWLAVLIGTLIGLGLALLYLALAKRFPGQTMIAIHNIVWGSFLGRLFSAMFLVYFLHEISLLIGAFIYFQKEFLLNTPTLVLAFIGTGIAIYLASQGLEVLARCCQIIILICIVSWFAVVLMVLPEIKMSSFQPFLKTPLPLLMMAILRCAAFNFSSGYIFLMFFPYIGDLRNTLSATIKGGAISLVILLSGVLVTTGALGPATGYFVHPALNASRLVNIGEIFTRMEVLTGGAFWLGCFVLVSIRLYAMMAASGELIKLKSLNVPAIPLWILAALLSNQNFTSISEETFYALKIFIWEALPFQYILPPLTLLVAIIRKLPREGSLK